MFSDLFGIVDVIIVCIFFIFLIVDVFGMFICLVQSFKDRGQEIVSGLVDFKFEYGVGLIMVGKCEVESFVEQVNIVDCLVCVLCYFVLMVSDKNLCQGDSKILDDWIMFYFLFKISL